MERRTYSKEFKQEAVQLSYDSDSPVAQVAENLGIRPELLYRWRREQRQEGDDAFRGKGMSTASEEEMRRLRRELDQVRMERDILKKALSVFARPTS
jgi:transposase